MPLLRTISCDQCFGGIWKIDERPDELAALMPHGTSVLQQLEQTYKNARRITESMAVRVLLYHLTGAEHTIAHQPSGKPYLMDAPYHISISHTQGYATVLLSTTCDVGIDIEAYGERILKVRDRVVGPGEQAATIYELLLHWSAKEAVFKILDREGIDFVRHLHVSGLQCVASSVQPDTAGQMKLDVDAPYMAPCTYRLHYATAQDYVLVYVCNSLKADLD